MPRSAPRLYATYVLSVKVQQCYGFKVWCAYIYTCYVYARYRYEGGRTLYKYLYIYDITYIRVHRDIRKLRVLLCAYNAPVTPRALDRQTRHFHQLNPLSDARCLRVYKYVRGLYNNNNNNNNDV